MPEINPLTNNQLFLKKIAENTGSDYDTGDVSEINPLTIDQIFLKEIAANTAGQSGDITELKGKVADNTGAIEAINENGCCNILPNNAISGTSHNVTFTVNSDGSVSFSVDSTPDSNGILLIANHLHFENDIKVSGLPNIEGCVAYLYDNTASQYIWINENDQAVIIDSTHDYGFVIAISQNISAGTTGTYYPMIYDARLNPTGYVQYAMTNRELTNAVNRGNVSVQGDGVKTNQQALQELYNLVDFSKITPYTVLWSHQDTNSYYYHLMHSTPFILTFIGFDRPLYVTFHLESALSNNNLISDNLSDGTSSNLSSDVLPNGWIYTIVY